MAKEADIRRNLIDQQLAEAGWSLEKSNLQVEKFLPDRMAQVKESTENYATEQGSSHASIESKQFASKTSRFADYALLGTSGVPLAIVEAKSDVRSPLEGMEQASEYADRIHQQTGKQPFIFLSNGDEVYFWERDKYPPRKVSGFHTPRDLADLETLRLYSQDLYLFQPENAIVEREYQHRAIKTIVDGLKLKKRKFLLVMATGTGKTRTVIALVDLLMRAGWIKRVLFLADRRELVKQAQEAFEMYLPQVSWLRIESGALGGEKNGRIHFATYPSMMQVLSQLSVGYYDLIIADESHRAIYKHYTEIFTHFDALQIGLTATPTDYIEHNTYEMFDCVNDLPTFEYSFETAVEQDHLVNFKVIEAQTHFQIEGIKAGELPKDLQLQLDEQGLDLSEINFEGTDLERKVTNTGTNDLLIDEFMKHCYRDARGLPHKSIIFAVSHNHALELLQSFNRHYPDLQARGLAKVIDSRMERAEKMLSDFKRQDMPRVAISVDMLDTGIDVPAIQTLVFAKPVYSQVKFWQMIGRGTRLWTDPLTNQRKNDFIILDHWNNFALYDRNPEGKVGFSHPDEPLPTKLFRIRLKKLTLLRQMHNAALEEETLHQLREMVQQLPRTNGEVRAFSTDLAVLDSDPIWLEQDISASGKLHRFIAPLMIHLHGLDTAALLFELHTEQLLLAHLEDKPELRDRYIEQIKDDLAKLPPNLPEVQTRERMRTWVENPDFWSHLDARRILDLQKELAPIMRYRMTTSRSIIKLHLPDIMQKRRWITYGPAGEGAFVDDYREQVEVRVKDLAEQVPVLAKLKQTQRPDVEEIQYLVDMLNRPDLFIREEVLRQVYENPQMGLIDFLRLILGGQPVPGRKERVEAAVKQYLENHTYFSPAQRRFIYALQSVLLRPRAQGTQNFVAFTLDQLLWTPFNRIGKADDLFNDRDLAELLHFANSQVA